MFFNIIIITTFCSMYKHFFTKKTKVLNSHFVNFVKVNQISSFLQSNNIFFFLRRVKLFVKGKYSRSRQYSKNMIYFGIWMNILVYFLLLTYCYKYSIVASYSGFSFLIFIFFLRRFSFNLTYLTYSLAYLYNQIKVSLKRII